MIKYVFLCLLALFSATSALLYSQDSDFPDDNIGLKLPQSKDEIKFKNKLNNYFQVDNSSLTLSSNLFVFEALLMNEEDLRDFLTLAQQINTVRLHSINISPSDLKFSYKIVVAYAFE